MRASLEFILGLLDRNYPAFVSQDDLRGTHRQALLQFQEMGFINEKPERNPAASCPHCQDGVPTWFGGRCLCPNCQSPVDPRHLWRWRFDLGALLAWLGKKLGVKGNVRQIDESLWHLGCLQDEHLLYECFFHRGGTWSGRGRRRFLAYRNALMLQPLPGSASLTESQGPCIALLELMRPEAPLDVLEVSKLIRTRGTVRFDGQSGALWVGDVWLGEVTLDSKEYFFLAYLYRHLDRYEAYADIKHFVLHRSGSTDTTEEATFCQRLKNRVKKSIPQIDRLIATTNKGSGYRLRRFVEL